jgi:CII-binding regulator of phage lambda lysogenization HflD
MAAEIGLADVMEHLAIAFGGIYEKLTERDQEVAVLRNRLDEQKAMIETLSNRIEATHRRLDSRTGDMV